MLTCAGGPFIITVTQFVCVTVKKSDNKLSEQEVYIARILFLYCFFNHIMSLFTVYLQRTICFENKKKGLFLTNGKTWLLEWAMLAGGNMCNFSFNSQQFQTNFHRSIFRKCPGTYFSGFCDLSFFRGVMAL